MMLKPDPLTQISHLYHFTDIRNIPLIRSSGGILPLTALNANGINIPAPGGNEWSHEADKRCGLDQYVHLCFRSQHPMEYQARQDGRIENTIFLQISNDVLKIPGVLFSPDVSNKSGVSCFTLEQARGLIDFEVLYTHTNWHDPAIRARLRAVEKCEILVPATIPLSMIKNMPNG